jgi:hypothetical protein
MLIALQVLILLTGNYTFFNWLTIALCVFLFAEQPGQAPEETWTHRGVTAAVTAFVLLTSGLQFIEMFSFPLPDAARSYLHRIAPFDIVNTYGLFAVMTTTRPEIIVEGSNDGSHWLAYEFRYKPGDVKRAPPWVAPYQPRLDWQMWFAALGSPRQNTWFYNFAARLMEGSAPVLRLLAHNPFPETPPRYLRAVVYDYQFTGLAERKSSGAWWRREQKAMYLQPVSLRAGRGSLSEAEPHLQLQPPVVGCLHERPRPRGGAKSSRQRIGFPKQRRRDIADDRPRVGMVDHVARR